MTVGIEVSGRAQSAENLPGTGFRDDDALALEKRGWTSAGIDCTPKLAALSAASQPANSEPIPIVSYVSRGNALVIAGADADRARNAAHSLASGLSVTLAGGGSAPLGAVRLWNASIESLDGYLGEFTAAVAGLDAGGKEVPAKFDLVLDFSQPPRFDMRLPPQGYYAAPSSEAALDAVIGEMREAVGEFEKPRYFAYRENICAHSRSEVVGCNACIEVCATGAISSDGDHVKVDPHLCMGCGTCATVCPSGAMSYQFPRVSDRGEQLRQMLSAYRQAGGTNASIVFHDAQGREALSRAASSGSGLPAHALPLECWSVSSVGLDLLLPALALGASRVVLLAGEGADGEDRAALAQQMAIGQAIVSGLGYSGKHFHLVDSRDARALDAALAMPGAIPGTPAGFTVSNDKRTAIEFAVEHLAKQAPVPANEIALPAGAPFGEIRVEAKKCTMCMACVGACPESALMDGGDTPLLKFLERNCVQCGLCEATCPEEAIALSPRLLLGAAAREARVLNRAEPFNCIRCSKPFGTRQVVETMLGRLSGHSMFTGEGALRRLQMCADCRVVDMMSSKNEVSVLKLGGEA